MHQIIHLSPVGCFTPARGKSMQKNREVSRVKKYQEIKKSQNPSYLALAYLPSMNSNETRCVLFATQNFNKRTESFQITIDDTVRHMEDKVKNLGVIFYSRLSFEHHIKYCAPG